jgi:hypothetical protein
MFVQPCNMKAMGYKNAIEIVLDRYNIKTREELFSSGQPLGFKNGLKWFYCAVEQEMGPNWGRSKDPEASVRDCVQTKVSGYKKSK